LALSVSQLQAFSQSGISGFTGSQLGLLVNKWGTAFTSLYNNTNWAQVNYINQIEFKALVPSKVVPIISLPVDVSQLVNFTWIDIALVKQSPPPLFNIISIPIIPNCAISGLRTDQISNFDILTMSYITPTQGQYLLSDTISVVTALQISYMNSLTIGNFSNLAFGAINNYAISGLTTAQISHININIFATVFICDQIKSFTGSQINSFSVEQKSIFNNRIANCTSATTTTSSTTTSSTTTSSTTGKNHGLSGDEISAIILGSIAGVAIVIGIGLYIFMKYQYHTHERRRLLNL